MELLLRRKRIVGDATIGELFVNGKFECFTIEDVDRGLDQSKSDSWNNARKVYATTAVPFGRYEVIVNWSPRFKRNLPLLLNVDAFVGIRIHPGNTAKDSEGCILPNTSVKGSKGSGSVKAFNPLFRKIQTALKSGKVFITIQKDF